MRGEDLYSVPERRIATSTNQGCTQGGIIRAIVIYNLTCRPALHSAGVLLTNQRHRSMPNPDCGARDSTVTLWLHYTWVPPAL